MDTPLTSQERYLTVPELAELLRIKERKVYDLASNGTVPCSKATGKLLFPEQAVHRWLAQGQVTAAATDKPRPAVFLGSHDPLLDWALRQSECGIASYFDGSQDGLNRFAAGEGLAAGLHIFDTETAEWNVPAMTPFAGSPAVLLGFAARKRGLVVHPNLASKITCIADLAGRSLTPRQEGAGTRTLFDYLIRRARLPESSMRINPIARSEADAVLDVASGVSDATFGLEYLARQHKLGFVPLIEERFDLLVCRRAYFEPQMQRFVAFLATDSFKQHADAMDGYDVTDAGVVRWNG